MIRYEIIIITYNQENTIEDALYSAIKQTLPPYKISIFDDCSTDQTAEKIKSIIANEKVNIEFYRNENNKGIFPNFNQALNKASGDIVCLLAGDDELEINILENYDKYIKDNNIDIHQPIWMIPNITEIYPNNKRKQINQHFFSSYSIFELILANKIRSFELGLTLPAIKQSLIRTEIGYQADNLKSLLLSKKINIQLVDFFGYKYRTFTGVTTKSKQMVILNSRLKVLNILLTDYSSLLSNREIKLVKYEIATVKYSIEPNIHTYFYMIYTICTIITLPHLVIKPTKFLKQLVPISLKNIVKSIVHNL